MWFHYVGLGRVKSLFGGLFSVVLCQHMRGDLSLSFWVGMTKLDYIVFRIGRLGNKIVWNGFFIFKKRLVLLDLLLEFVNKEYELAFVFTFVAWVI